MNLNRYFFGNISFPLIAQKEGLGGIKNRLKSLEESQYWDQNTLLEYQTVKLKNLCIHAYENTFFTISGFRKPDSIPIDSAWTTSINCRYWTSRISGR